MLYITPQVLSRLFKASSLFAFLPAKTNLRDATLNEWTCDIDIGTSRNMFCSLVCTGHE